MKGNRNNIIDFINKVLNNLKHYREDISIKNNEREQIRLESRIEAFEEIKKSFEWEVYLPEQKQSSRILNVAKMRREEIDVTDHLNQIELYSKIQEVIPYIMAVSYKINMEDKHLTEDLLNFCENQLEQIDLSSRSIKVNFPSIDKIEKAFKSFNERIKPNKIPVLKVYYQPEVTQKIDELYQLFLCLSNK